MSAGSLGLETRYAPREWVVGIQRPREVFAPHTFSLLGKQADLADVGWEGKQCSALWRYHQHYFDDLNARDALERTALHEDLIERWIREHEQTEGIGLDPYPTSRRIVNWVKWHLSVGRLAQRAQASLSRQAVGLRGNLEWHLLGNHLLANAKALVFAGAFFRGERADTMFAFGERLFASQLRMQVLTDGGHVERSPMYHAQVLEDLLDVISLYATFEFASPRSWGETAQRMLRWLSFMTHPDGEVAYFNDSTAGMAAPYAELAAYAERLGIPVPMTGEQCVHLRDSGYVSLDSGRCRVMFNLAPLGPDFQPGHAHADTLSFELAVMGERIIANPGTSTYEPGQRRSIERATASHSTLVVDGANSSDVWASFRVGRRARVSDVDVQCDGTRACVSAQHDGYSFLVGSPCHRRTWTIRPGCLAIEDVVMGTGDHVVEQAFPLGPRVRPRRLSGSVIAFDVTSSVCETRAVFLEADPACTLVVEPSQWAAAFGTTLASHVIRCTVAKKIPLRLRTVIHWDSP